MAVTARQCSSCTETIPKKFTVNTRFCRKNFSKPQSTLFFTSQRYINSIPFMLPISG